MTEKIIKLGVIGDPIKHSLSPIMHTAAISDLGLNATYEAFHVKPQELESFIKSMPKKGITGLNVTIPHKEATCNFMDELVNEAVFVNSVNTIHYHDGKWIGYNTDGLGYIASLANQASFDVIGKNIIILGAGGATKGLIYSLAHAGAKKITILNRTLSKAQNILEEACVHFSHLKTQALSLDKIAQADWESCHLFINTTSMGMDGIPIITLPLNRVNKETLISDIVYTPLETPLLKQAKALGLKTHPGWGMLLYQGALAFEIWTGITPPATKMEEALLKVLQGR